MRRVYGLLISLAMLLAATGIAGADTNTRSASNQQAINLVITRALSQRGIPYTYGGGDTAGPTRGVPDTPALVPATSALGPTRGAGVLGIPQSGATGPSSTVETLGAATTQPGFDSSTTTMANPNAASTNAASTNVVGYDASGLIVYAFAGAGIKMPRSSGQQYMVGRKIPPALALPGDLIFYGPDGSQSVALFIGNGQMVEAGNPAVTVSPVRTANMAPYLTRIIE